MINLIAAIFAIFGTCVSMHFDYYTLAVFNTLLFFLNTALYAVEEIKDHLNKNDQ